MQGNVVGLIAGYLREDVALETTVALPQNVNYAAKSAAFASLFHAAPELSRLLDASAPSRPESLEDTIEKVEKAVFLLLVY